MKELKKKFQITKINFFYPKLENGSSVFEDTVVDPKGCVSYLIRKKDPIMRKILTKSRL